MPEEVEVTTVDGVPAAGDTPRLHGMPMLGLGTWKLDEPESCEQSVLTALDLGYRHIDTAQAYGNEEDVGAAIEMSHVDREDIFLATKVWIENLEHEDVLKTARESLEKLGVDSVDLLYVHWPAGEYEAESTLAAFDELHAEGVTERIAVSNFEPDQLAEACELTEANIFANQFECHPMLPQEELREACDEHDVYPVAYSPLARGEIIDHPVISDIAGKHEASEAQVALAWLRQQGVTAIPKAEAGAHIRDNWGSLAVRLDDGDMAKINDIDEVERMVDPDFGPWN